MLVSRLPGPASAGALLLSLCALCALAPTAGAAGTPAAVTVRVEGLNSTLLPLTSVTTTTAPVVKDGNHADSCTGTSVAGALEQATHGNWTGPWYSGLGYSVTAILGESYPFTQNYYWSFWLDRKPSTVGICGAELKHGDDALFFVDCYGIGCPPSPNPLGLNAPAVAQQGTPMAVSVTAYANADGTPSPAQGANVSGGGVSAITNSAGTAQVSFPSTGTFTLQATAPNSVRSETHTVCVHNGNDGNCGTTAPPATTPTQPTTPTPTLIAAHSGPTFAPPPYTGPFALVAHAAGPIDGHFYRRGHAPRELQGTITSHVPVTSVYIRLRRSHGGRCWAYSGVRELFYPTRCGQAFFFKVGHSSSFTYLLPAPLAPGWYVYDVTATDAAGNRVAPARGSSRIVFDVG